MKKLFVLILLAGSALRAADAVQTTQLATARTTVAAAQAAARRDDVAAAEQLLTTMNHSTPNSSAWHVETAQRIIQLVHDLPRHGSAGRSLSALSSRALEHLARAETLATQPHERSSIKALAGLIHERFRGDHAAALTSYRAAADLNRENAIAAKAADRLQRVATLAAAQTRKK